MRLIITTGCATKSVFVRQNLGQERKISTIPEPNWIRGKLGYFIGIFASDAVDFMVLKDQKGGIEVLIGHFLTCENSKLQR